MSIMASAFTTSNSNLGVGTTGLGDACNVSLSQDRDNFINEYLKDKERETMIRRRERSNDKPTRMTFKERLAFTRAAAEKIQAQKEAQRAEVLKERQALEQSLAEDRERMAREKSEQVQYEKEEALRRKAEARQEREAYEKRRRKKLQADIKRERSYMVEEEAFSAACVQQKHEEIRQVRQLQKQRADGERQVRENLAKQMIAREKKKLMRMETDRRNRQKEALMSRQDDIRNMLKDKQKQQQKQKEDAIKVKELLSETKALQKQQAERERAERMQKQIEEKRQLIESRKQEAAQARKNLKERREAYLTSIMSSPRYGSQNDSADQDFNFTA